MKYKFEIGTHKNCPWNLLLVIKAIKQGAWTTKRIYSCLLGMTWSQKKKKKLFRKDL